MFFYQVRWEGYGEEENTWEPASSLEPTVEMKRWMRAAREGKEVNAFSTKNMEQPNSLYAMTPEVQAYMGKPVDTEYVRSDLLLESVLDSLQDHSYRPVFQPGSHSLPEEYDEIGPENIEEIHTTKMIHTLAQLPRVRAQVVSRAPHVKQNPRLQHGPGGWFQGVLCVLEVF